MPNMIKCGPGPNIFYQNVRGIRTKCLNLYNSILSCDFDVLCFTETWLQSDIFDSELCDTSKYDIFRCDRNLTATSKSTGGGVMICARRELGASLKHEWCCGDTLESICVSIQGSRLGSSGDLCIILVYLPPDDMLYISRIGSLLNSIKNFYELNPSDNYLIVGDFNFSCVLWNEETYSILHQGKTDTQNAIGAFIDELYYLGLIQYNLILNSCNNILDLCFSNLALSVFETSPLSKLDKYHPALSINIPDLHFKPLKEIAHPHYNFHKANYDKIITFLNNINWQEILDTGTVDDAVAVFYEKVYECFSLYIPISTFNNSYPVWYSKALIKIIREKTKFHIKWKKFKNPRDYDTFSLLRTRQHRVQDQCFERFTSSTERLIRHSPKVFWKYVKSKRGGSSYPQYFTIGGVRYDNPSNICSAFSAFFESVFSAHSSSNSVPINIVSDNTDVLSHIVVSEDAVLKKLQSLDKSKGAGCDLVPPIFLSTCAQSIALPITILFRRSLDECVFPSLWKKADIIPVHKKGPKTKIENYRPISKLITVAKVFEDLVLDSIYPLVSRGIPETQHGFLKGRSTVSNLACFTEFVIRNMEGGGQVDVVYTDFEKAFDRVDHDILLAKLNSLGIHGDLLRWVNSYLSNRSQAVVLGGYKSDYITVPSGVPQGSHLGPLFYNAYIYDIHKCFKNSKHLLYADDKKIFISIKSFADCELLQADLDNLFEYYRKNKINLSIQKCQCISFTRKTNPITFSYNFDGVVVERVGTIRDLGVILDSKMDMTSHLDHIINRANRNLGFVMRTCRNFKHPISFKIIYYAYVRCILEYASSIWSPFYAVHVNRIERIQKKFISHLNFIFRKHTNSYEQNCRIYKLLTLEERRDLLDMGLLHDILRGGLSCPDLLAGLSLRAPSRRTRNAAMLYVPSHHTNYGKNVVLTRLARTYNNKFMDVDPFICSKHTFKNNIISTMLNPN